MLRLIRTARGSATVAAALAAVVCAGGIVWSRAGPPPERRYENVLAEIRNGEFERSQQDAHGAGSRFRNDPRWALRFRLLEAESLLESGKSAEALALISEASPVSDPEYEVGRRLLRARRLILASALGDAGVVMAEAQTIAEHSGREDLVSEMNFRRGQLLGRQAKLGGALEAFEKVRASAAQSGDWWHLAAAINGIGMLSMVRSKCDDAIPLFQQAEEIWRKNGARYGVAGATNNIGLCYTQLGDFDKALDYRRRVEQFAPPGLLLANALGEHATLHLYQQQYDDAISQYRRARDMAQRFEGSSDAARWASNLTLALIAREDWAGAEDALQQARSLKPEPRSLPFLELNAGVIALGRGRTADARAAIHRAISLAPESPAVQWRASAVLARIAMRDGDPKEANARFEETIQVIDESRSDLNRNEHRLTFLSRMIQFYQDYVDALVTQGNNTGAHAIADLSRARILAERMAAGVEPHRPRTAAEFQAIARKSGAVWLSYWLGPTRSFLWVTTADRVQMFTLPAAAEISGLVDEYRSFTEVALRDPMRDRSQAGQRLYEILVAPAEAVVRGAKRVIVIPDGALHQLAFDTLPVYSDDSSRYWIDDVAVATVPSFGVYRGEENKWTRSSSALLIGDPTSATPEYPPLAHASSELAEIRSTLGASTVIRGGAATAAAYVESGPSRYSILHLAAHAEANRQSPLESAIILAPSDRGFRLPAREVMNVPLRADLVTLSACRSSGSRTYSGEGFVGLAWAFLHAGAKSVVAGLWNVADESTASLMSDFYREIGAGSAPADALRHAKLTLRKSNWAKPYYWGSFQCYLR